MWSKLNYKKKNLLLIAAMVLILYVAYLFSFKHTITAIKLNSQLKKEHGTSQILDGSFPQINRKNNFYITALKSYRVKPEDRENRLWQAVSGMALANAVQISFNPGLQLVTDTTAVQKGMVTQQFAFKGNYFNIVKLLDTLGRSAEIGEISELKLVTKKEVSAKAPTNQLTLQLTLAAIAR